MSCLSCSAVWVRCDHCQLEERLKSMELASFIAKKIRVPLPTLEVGDRVRYYGAWNEVPEVTSGTVVRIKKGLVLVELDSHMNNENKKVPEPCDQWAHPKQLRRLKQK